MSNNIITCIPENEKIRFIHIITTYYSNITTSDLRFMNIEDF